MLMGYYFLISLLKFQKNVYMILKKNVLVMLNIYFSNLRLLNFMLLIFMIVEYLYLDDMYYIMG